MNRVLRLLACVLLFACTARAQDALSSPPMAAPSASALQDFNANQPGSIPVPDASLGVVPAPTPFHWGPVDLRPHFLYRYLYGNGIPARTGTNAVSGTNATPAGPAIDTKTSVNSLTPGLLLQIGSHWSIDYAPTYYWYSSTNFNNHLDEALHLNFATTYRDWVFNLNHTYSDTFAPLVETGQQTDVSSQNTALDAYYSINSKWSLQLSAAQNLKFTAGFNDLHEWTTTDWLVYQLAPGLQASFGILGTYDNVETGNDMVAEQYRGRISWQTSPKTSVELVAGIEDRQLVGSVPFGFTLRTNAMGKTNIVAAMGKAPDLINPIFNASFLYYPLTNTSLKFSAERVVAPTFFNNELTERINLRGEIRQRFFGRYFVTVDGEYSTVDYRQTIGNLPAVRHDDYYSLTFRVSTAVLKRGSIAAFYTLSDNSSDVAAFGFNSHQGGVELGFNY